MKMQLNSNNSIFHLSILCVAVVLAIGAMTGCAGKASYFMPASMDPSAKYVFFLHNYYVEKNGPDGDCKYGEILKAFADRGFVVISELRTGKIVPCVYAAKVVERVNRLLQSGVPPQHITVAGHSKGGVITLCVASQLADPDINYVVMAGCEIAPVKKYKLYPDFAKLRGRMLSIYASSDTIASSCSDAFASASKELSGTEIQLESDAGHRLFFAPQEIWLSPIIKWINIGGHL